MQKPPAFSAFFRCSASIFLGEFIVKYVINNIMSYYACLNVPQGRRSAALQEK